MNFPAVQTKGDKFQSLLEEKIKSAAASKLLNIKALVEKAGVSESTIYKAYKNGKARPSTLEKLAKALEIDPIELSSFVDFNSSESLVEEDSSIYGRPGKLIPTKKIQLYLSQLPDKDAEYYIPYYDVEITAGKIELYFDDIDEIPEGYIYAPQYRDCIACNVKGDSMYDRIYPGSRLYVYHLPNRKYIDYGQIYLVVLDGYRLLKYIHPHPSDDTKIRLSSYNKHYHHWDVEKADILNLFLVKGYENQNAM